MGLPPKNGYTNIFILNRTHAVNIIYISLQFLCFYNLLNDFSKNTLFCIASDIMRVTKIGFFYI